MDSEMKCDMCKANDLNEVLVLRKNKFTYPDSREAKKFRRVCLKCGKKLYKSGVYDLGSYWCKTLSAEGIFL